MLRPTVITVILAAALWRCDAPRPLPAGRAHDADPISSYLARTSLDGESCTRPDPARLSRPSLSDYTRSGKVISPYDDIMRYISLLEGQDWRLLSAIAYEESRFHHGVVSVHGARGIMQITPIVARQFGVDPATIDDPEVNIYLAARLLRHLGDKPQLVRGSSGRDRLCILLAAYNAGVGHVVDARRLAAKLGYDPDSWEDVALCLQRKSEPAYYEDEDVVSGRFTGYASTAAFVNSVISRYDRYCRLAEL